MKNKAIIITLIAVTSLVFSGAHVSADPLDTPVPTPSSSASAEPTPSATPNIDTLSPPSQEIIEQNLWSEVSATPTPTPTPTASTPLPHEILAVHTTPTQTTNSYGEACPTVYGSWTRGCPTVPNPDPGCVTGRGLCPGEHAGWALVDANGNVSGGVIVCTPEVCGANSPLIAGNSGYGGGYWAGQRLVLQTVQDDPVEAASSANGVGNVAGYSSGARYNFASGQWTLQSGNDTYNMAIAYPAGSDHLTLIYGGSSEETPLTPSPSPTSGDSEGTIPEITPTVVQQRVVPIEPTVINNRIVINERVKEVVFKDRVIIIATKGNKKKIWVYKMVKNSIRIKIPIKYLSWKISFKYTVG